MDPKFEKIACSSTISNLNKNKLDQLEQVLLKWLPESVHMLNICRIMMQKRFPKTEHVELFGFVEDIGKNWETDTECPFIVCIQRPNLHTTKGISLLAPLEIRRSMIQAFDTLIGWEEHQAFQVIPEQFASPLQELCNAHGSSEGFTAVVLAILDIDKAEKFEIPCKSNVSVRKLEQWDMPEVIQNCHWAQEHTEREIEETIKTLPSCAAVSKNGELLSFVLLNSLGLFNLLYTPERFRKMGYGQLVMSGVSKWAVQELGIHPVSEAQEWNVASVRTMEKAGFQEIYRSRWFYFNPPTQSISE